MEQVLLAKGLKIVRGGHLILDVPFLGIKPGQVLALIGPNGAGKSTLLQAFSYLIKPSDGDIYFYGKPCHDRTSQLLARRRMATVFQDSFLLNGTVRFNVATGLRFRGFSQKEISEKTNFWIDRFRISHLANRQVKGLSGGEAQRVSLARAFAVEPEVLFLDEPFSSLDAPTRVHLMDELELIIKKTGVTTIFVTHDAEGIPFYAERIIVLDNGMVTQDETLIQLLNKPGTPFLKAFFRHILNGKNLTGKSEI
ncbi:MAG TPA: ATP-binding cassette domain-containing protein [Bacteroidales bacterium]|nr:ATP-binding cassette domain-containing protein [Bacteroidales bacterium]